MPEQIMQMVQQLGIYILGLMVALVGWGGRYVLSTLKGQIVALQKNCINRAAQVEAKVDANKKEHEAEISKLREETRKDLGKLDQDIKTVGVEVRNCMNSLRTDLFLELKSSRQEMTESVRQVNTRLDTLIASRQQNGQL